MTRPLDALVAGMAAIGALLFGVVAVVFVVVLNLLPVALVVVVTVLVLRAMGVIA